MSHRRWLLVLIVASLLAWYVGLGSRRAGAQYPVAQPILYEFTIAGCIPCEQMQPIVAGLKAAGHDVQVIDCTQGVPSAWQPLGKLRFPTFVAVRGATILGRIEGKCTEQQLKELINRVPNLSNGNENTPRVQPASEGWRPSSQSAAPAAVCRVRNRIGGQGTVAGKWFMGSGTLVEKTGGYGLIVTAAHTFDEGRGEITVAFPSGETYAAEMVDVDRPHDLAVLKIAAPAVTPVNIAPGDPQVGEQLQSAGYGGEGRYLVNTGSVTEFAMVDGVRGFFNLVGPARQGDSGGPVINSRGELVGVVQSTSYPDDPNKRVTACSCSRVRDLFRRVRARLQGQHQPAQPQRPPGSVQVTPDVPPVGTVPVIPLEPKPEQGPELELQPIQPNDRQHPDAITEAPKWDDNAAPQVDTPAVEQAPPSIVERAKERVVEGAKAVALSTLEKWLIGLGPGGWAVFGAWKLYRWRKGKAAASKLPPPKPPNWIPEVSPPPPAATCRYREPVPFPFEQTPLQRPAKPLEQRSPEALALEAENQRLHAELARKVQPVMYRQAPIGDNLPAFRQAMAMASDAQPHLRHAVKFFEDTFKVQQAGELTHA